MRARRRGADGASLALFAPPPIDWLLFRLFRRLPRYLVRDIEAKHPGWHVVGVRRGSSVELGTLPAGSAVVPCRELGCWVVIFNIELAQRLAAERR